VVGAGACCHFQSRCFLFIYGACGNLPRAPRKKCAFKNFHKAQYITIIISGRRLTFKKHENFVAEGRKKASGKAILWQKELNLCFASLVDREMIQI
jgi:hypothetical protein